MWVSFVGNDRRLSQKSGTRQENGNALDSPDLSPSIPDDREYLQLPLYIAELLSYRTYSRTLRSTDQKLLAVLKSRLKTYGDRAFSVAAPKLWTELPLDLRSLDTINLFKKHLKTDLFKKAYNV